MALLQLGLMRNRYRLTPSLLPEKSRLDRVGEKMLDGALEQALSSKGLALSGEVCIRKLEVPVRVRLSAGDTDIAAAWSRAIAESIAATLESRNENVVVYASRRQALLDMAVAVARRDTSRSWAWSQLGLWQAPGGASDAAAVDMLVLALEAERQEVLPVLGALGRLGMLAALAARLAPRHVERVALAAALATGLEPADVAPPIIRTDEAADARHLSGTTWHGADKPHFVGRGPTLDLAASLARRSAVFAGLAGAPATRVNAEVRHWLAVLVALEADPGTGMRSAAAASELLVAIAGLLAAGTTAIAQNQPAVAQDQVEKQSTRPDSPDDREAGTVTHPAPAVDAKPLRREEGAGDSRYGVDTEPARTQHAGAEDQLTPAAGSPEAPVSQRHAVTAAGGLLFLVHLVGRLRLPERLANANELQTRPLRWTLHRLAMLVAGLADHDPAALAFCGLGPDAPPPSEGELPPTDPELAFLEAVKVELEAMLADSLERREEPAAAVLAEVCARRAEIVADLAWIDVLLELDEVSIEVRRAGLDIDPGWVPWLGVALRFVYG